MADGPAPDTPPLRQRTRLLLLLLATAFYAAIAVPIGVHKGGDLVTEFGQVERWLTGAPLYDRTAFLGVWWPPFGVVAVAPFTLLSHWSVDLAKGTWALLSAGCVAWSVARAGRTWGWAPALLALLAVSKPLQTNAEALNINAVLLALVVAAAVALREGRDGRAGLWIGMATALKAFPGLLFLYLAWRRQWRALGVAVATAVGLTVLAVLPYGPAGAVTALGDWVALSSAVSVPVWARTSQSLEALVLRLDGSALAVLAAKVVVLAAVAAALRRRPAVPDILHDVGLVVVTAVLVSPVAWDHYYVLFFPAWVALLTQPSPADGRRTWNVALVFAGVLTSGIVLAAVPTWLRWELLLRSIYAWGAVLLLMLLVVQRAPRWVGKQA